MGRPDSDTSFPMYRMRFISCTTGLANLLISVSLFVQIGLPAFTGQIVIRLMNSSQSLGRSLCVSYTQIDTKTRSIWATL